MKKKQKLIGGVLGGMGPLATVDFMSRVIALNPINNEEDHVHLFVDQNPHIPNRQIKSISQEKAISSSLIDSAKKLEVAGANFIIMPCNTAHIFAKDIIKAISVPFLHIVEETVDEISKIYPNYNKVGLMATSACLTSEIYQSGLIKSDKVPVCPSLMFQEQCMKTIFAIKDGEEIEPMKYQMIEVAEHLINNGAEIIIAGCTEIPLIIKSIDIEVPLISSTEVLAMRTIEFATNIKLSRIL
jgi:aspartate racemase